MCPGELLDARLTAPANNCPSSNEVGAVRKLGKRMFQVVLLLGLSAMSPATTGCSDSTGPGVSGCNTNFDCNKWACCPGWSCEVNFPYYDCVKHG